VIGSADPEFSRDVKAIIDELEKHGLEGYFAPPRTEDAGKDAFCQEICLKIRSSRFCVVMLNNPVNKECKEVRSPSPNVHFEYGIALTLEQEIIPLYIKNHVLPFDVRNIDSIPYGTTEEIRENKELLEKELREKLEPAIRAKKVQTEPTVRMPKRTEFEKRFSELRGTEGLTDRDMMAPKLEIFIGSSRERIEWLSKSKENFELAKCAPYPFARQAGTNVVPRPDYYEYEKLDRGHFFRIHSDGFFHCIFPLRSLEDEPGKPRYYIVNTISQIASVLLFASRLMDNKRLNIDQTCRILLSGVQGKRMDHRPETVPDDKDHFYHFPNDRNQFTYEVNYNPTQPWNEYKDLLVEVYSRICADLGMMEVKKENILPVVEEIILHLHKSELGKSYDPAGLRSISIDEWKLTIAYPR